MEQINLILGLLACISIIGLPNGILCEENPCHAFTFDKCTPDPSWIINEPTGIDEDVCQILCSSDSTCKFYTYAKENQICQLINEPQSNYLATCEEVGLPRSETIDECNASNDVCKVMNDKFSLLILFVAD